MTLYEIKETILNAINNIEIDEETGEILNVDSLDGLKEQFEEKAENVALYIKNSVAEADAIKNEEKKLAQRRKSLVNQSDRLKKYLADMMTETGNTRISTPRVALSFRKSTAVETDKEFMEWAKVNADDLLFYKEPEISKTAIKQAIKDGKTVEFARMVDNQSLVIR